MLGNDQPKLTTSVIWAALMLGLLYLAWTSAGQAQMLFSIGVLVALGAAAGNTIVYAVNNSLDFYARKKRADTETPLNRLVEGMRNLTPDQLEMLKFFTPQLYTLEGEPMDIALVDLHGQRIPKTFIFSFFGKGEPGELEPIGRYSEGSWFRDWAHTLTYWCVENQWAEPARGPHPAKWKNKAAALHWAETA